MLFRESVSPPDRAFLRINAPLTENREAQTDERELRGEESDAEGEREAKRLRCVGSTELCGETGMEDVSRGSIE